MKLSIKQAFLVSAVIAMAASSNNHLVHATDDDTAAAAEAASTTVGDDSAAEVKVQEAIEVVVADDAGAADTAAAKECTAEEDCIAPPAEEEIVVPPVTDEGEKAEESTTTAAEEDPSCPSRPHVIRCAAKYLDTNQNGQLERSELETAMNAVPWLLRSLLNIIGSIDAIMKKCDANGDGAIDIDVDMKATEETCLATCFKRKAFKRLFFPDCTE
ncbi:hypothetical protein ACHAXM_000723 [Skeletonema potamos]